MQTLVPARLCLVFFKATGLATEPAYTKAAGARYMCCHPYVAEGGIPILRILDEFEDSIAGVPYQLITSRQTDRLILVVISSSC